MTTTIRRLLIANRGEIAVRILRACRAMGITTIAVYSDADADALHVREADEAIRIGPAPSADSYLSIDRIVEACRATDADAVHPGYGFLSENPLFAAACAEAGITFVGPTARAMEQMGSKSAAKALAEAAGVPVVPGYYGDDQSDAVLLEQARTLGVPLLLKASAGGGGRGMRLVTDLRELEGALTDARSEAKRAFGDDRMLIERYVTRPRHIEIQLLGDTHGTVLHLGERECSVQRRHQKVLEESPSTFVTPSMRARMGADAVRLAQAIGYVGAGTVEFVVAEDGTYYFLEMNTRLQVEHPVTEAVTGIDLVRAQIVVAEGRPLPWTQDQIVLTGAAIEARIYAEDPANGFLPASGTIRRWIWDPTIGVRMDAGVGSGSEVSVHYDPMLAKVISHGQTREDATRLLVRALQAFDAAGVITNRRFLIDVLSTDAWATGATTTAVLDDLYPTGWSPTEDAALESDAALACAVWSFDQRMRAREHLPSLVGAFRNNRIAPQRQAFLHPGGTAEVLYTPVDRAFTAGEGTWLLPTGARIRYRCDEDSVQVTGGDGRSRTWTIAVWRAGEEREYAASSPRGTIVFKEEPRFPLPVEEQLAGGCIAPMNGTVLRVMVKEGDAVVGGQTLLVLEAMKMEHRVSAQNDGTVRQLTVAEGDLVDAGTVLVVVDDDVAT